MSASYSLFEIEKFNDLNDLFLALSLKTLFQAIRFIETENVHAGASTMGILIRLLCTLLVFSSASAQAADTCEVQVKIFLSDTVTGRGGATTIDEVKIFPVDSGFCDGSSGAGFLTTAEKKAFFNPMINSTNISARKVGGMNFLGSAAGNPLYPNGNLTATVVSVVSGVRKTVSTQYYSCTESSCTNVSRPRCGVEGLGMASVAPTTVAATDIACINFWKSNKPSGAFVVFRGDVQLLNF